MNTDKLYLPLTGREIQNFLPNISILKYSDLKDLKSLPNGNFIILYELFDNMGHWCTVLRTPEGIEFFDPYGEFPDNELEWVDRKFKKKFYENHSKLLQLLYDSFQNINYNQYKFQGPAPISTCGRWCILRNLFNFLTCDQFYNMVNKTSKESKLSFDQIVSIVI